MLIFTCGEQLQLAVCNHSNVELQVKSKAVALSNRQNVVLEVVGFYQDGQD